MVFSYARLKKFPKYAFSWTVKMSFLFLNAYLFKIYLTTTCTFSRTCKRLYLNIIVTCDKINYLRNVITHICNWMLLLLQRSSYGSLRIVNYVTDIIDIWHQHTAKEPSQIYIVGNAKRSLLSEFSLYKLVWLNVGWNITLSIMSSISLGGEPDCEI